MHAILVTKGIILHKRGAGEANTVVFLLTEHLGLLRASAKSARFEVSKLRYGLEPLTLARFSLVRGKNEWKLVGVEEISKACVGKSLLRRQASGRIAKLLMRLVQGEEPVPALFRTVEDGFVTMSTALSEQDAKAIECVLVLRILSHLGYLPHTQELAPFIQDNFFSLELAAAAARSRSLLIKTINESLGATGL